MVYGRFGEGTECPGSVGTSSAPSPNRLLVHPDLSAADSGSMQMGKWNDERGNAGKPWLTLTAMMGVCRTFTGKVRPSKSLHPPQQFLCISIFHQREPEPFLSEVLDGRSYEIDRIVNYHKPVMCL